MLVGNRTAPWSTTVYNNDQAGLDGLDYSDDVVARHEDGHIGEDVLDLSIQVGTLG